MHVEVCGMWTSCCGGCRRCCRAVRWMQELLWWMQEMLRSCAVDAGDVAELCGGCGAVRWMQEMLRSCAVIGCRSCAVDAGDVAELCGGCGDVAVDAGDVWWIQEMLRSCAVDAELLAREQRAEMERLEASYAQQCKATPKPSRLSRSVASLS